MNEQEKLNMNKYIEYIMNWKELISEHFFKNLL